MSCMIVLQPDPESLISPRKDCPGAELIATMVWALADIILANGNGGCGQFRLAYLDAHLLGQIFNHGFEFQS